MAACVSSATGLSKIRYTTRKAAKLRMQKFLQKHPENKVHKFGVYRCPECGLYHFGREEVVKQRGPSLRDLPRQYMAELYMKGVSAVELADLYDVKDANVLRGWLYPALKAMGGDLR